MAKIFLSIFLSENCHLCSSLLCKISSSLFTDEEIQRIRNVTFHDVLIAVMSAEATDIQNNVFVWMNGTEMSPIFNS